MGFRSRSRDRRRFGYPDNLLPEIPQGTHLGHQQDGHDAPWRPLARRQLELYDLGRSERPRNADLQVLEELQCLCQDARHRSRLHGLLYS